MKKEDFCSQAPPFIGDILWKHLQTLQSENQKTSTQNTQFKSSSDRTKPVPENSDLRSSSSQSSTFSNTQSSDMHLPTFSSYGHHFGNFAGATSHILAHSRPGDFDYPAYGPPQLNHYNQMYPLPHFPRQMSQNNWFGAWPSRHSSLASQPPVPDQLPHGYQPSYTGLAAPHQEVSTSTNTIQTHSGPIQLWQFLLELLSDRTCQHFIAWTGVGWEFKLRDPDEVKKNLEIKLRAR